MLLKRARKYRKLGKLALAKNTYEQVLSIDPSEIKAYNGIRKVLLAKKNKEFEVIQLYQNAVTNLPNNLKFRQRLYNEFYNAAMGNKRVLHKLTISGSPLLFVKEKFEAMIQEYPDRKNLIGQIAKINKYIELDVEHKKPHENQALKSYRKNLRNAHKKRFGKIQSQETTLRLVALEEKPSSDDRIAQIREMSKINILALRDEKKYSEALDASLKYLNTTDASDPYFMKQFRELSKQLHAFDAAITFEQQNHASKGTFWSGVALFDSYMRKMENSGQSTYFNQADTLLQFLQNKASDPGQLFEVQTRKLKSYLIRNESMAAKNLIFELCRQKMGVKDAHSIDRVNFLAARYLQKNGDSDFKNKILTTATNPNAFTNSNDEFIRNIALLNFGRSFENPIHIANLQRLISKI